VSRLPNGSFRPISTVFIRGAMPPTNPDIAYWEPIDQAISDPVRNHDLVERKAKYVADYIREKTLAGIRRRNVRKRRQHTISAQGEWRLRRISCTIGS
jgi:hypothetical protein